jgi:hypothetical protein
MASFIGDLVVRVTASTSGLEKGLGRVQSMMQATVGVVKAGVQAITRNLLLIGTLGAAAGVGLLKLSADAETMRTQFKVLTGSAENALVMMKKIEKFAASTPYGKMEIGDAARQLLAFGGSQERVIDELRVLGDIASGTGTPIGELAELYGKARVQGRLYMQDVNQFSGRGINIRDSLARQFGDVNKAVEQGKVGFYELQVALDELAQSKFANMMVEQSSTLNGLWSTFLDTLEAIGVQIGDAISPYIKNILSVSSTFLDNFSKLGDKMAFLKRLLAGIYEWAVAAIKYRIDDVFAYMLEAGTPIMKALGETMRAAIDPFFEQTPGRIGAKATTTVGGDQFDKANRRLGALFGELGGGGEATGTFAGVPGIAGVIPAPSTLVDPKMAGKLKGGNGLTGLFSGIGENLQGPLAAMTQAALNKGTGLATQAGAWAGVFDRWFGGSKQKFEDGQSAGAMRRGSQEAYSSLVKASMRGKDPVVAATEKQTAALLGPLGELVSEVKAGGIGLIQDFLP